MPKAKPVPLELRFDEARAEQAFRLLSKLWRERNKPGTPGERQFGGIVLPQDIYPRPDDRVVHAIWLYIAAIFMRGGVVSEDPFAPLYRIFTRFPWMFDPAQFGSDADSPKAENDVLVVFEAIEMHNYKKDQYARAWVHNMRLLADHWRGNPLLIFYGVKDFEQAFARIDGNRKTAVRRGDGILGMRRKIFSLLTIWLQEKHLIKLFPCPIPVDFHAMRLLWALDILEVVSAPAFVPKPEKLGQDIISQYEVVRVTEKFVDIITKWSQIFIHRIGLSHVDVNPALWCLSRDMCAGHFQNGSDGRGAAYRTPELLESGALHWPVNYHDRCVLCPLESMCSHAIPNTPQYLYGLLMRMERVRYPQKRPVFPGLESFVPLRRHKSGMLREAGQFEGKKTLPKKTKKPRDTDRDLFPDQE